MHILLSKNISTPMPSTIHQRHLLSFFDHESTISLRVLKQEFVDSGEMNQTTLYRILDRFLQEGLIHRAEFSGEKYFTRCRCDTSNDAIKLQCCISCRTIEEDHTPLPPDALSSETIELIQHCKQCGTPTPSSPAS